MHFKFSEEQKLFQEAFGSLLENKCSPVSVRKSWETGSQIEGLWEAIGQMGALGIQAPEAVGGSNLLELETILLMETAGYFALPEPFLEHTAVVIPTLAAVLENSSSPPKGAQKQEWIQTWLQKAVEGKVKITAGHPNSSYVAYGTQADAFLLPEDGDLFLLATDQVKIHPQKSLDTPRSPCRIEWSPTEETQLIGVDVDLAFNRGALASAGECLGLASKLLDMAVEYTQERTQFGKPIGAQQAVKHHLADVAIAIEHARPSVYAAAWAVATDSNEMSREVSAAKALAGSAVSMAARKVLQCFGAIGYTVENDLSFWLKKGWVSANSWGSSDFHLNRAADLLL